MLNRSYEALLLTVAIWQVADYGLQTYQDALPLVRGTQLQLPRIQPFAILRVNCWLFIKRIIK